MATTDDKLIGQVQQVAAGVAADCDTIEPQLFHEARELEASKRFEAAGFGPTGKWRFAPEHDRMKALGAVRQELDAEIGRKLGATQDMIEMLEKTIPPLEQAAAEAPSAEEAYKRRFGTATIERGVAVNLAILDELRTARLVPELATRPIAEVLAQYEQALWAPNDDLSAAIIRMTERAVADNRLAAPKTTEDAQVLTKLRKKIAEVQDARIPQELKNWREAAKRFRKTLRLADAAGIKPIRPRTGA